MNIAIQAPKKNKVLVLSFSTVLAAAIGFYGFSQRDRAPSLDKTQVHNTKPQVTQIQKQEQPTVVVPVTKPKTAPSSEKHYTVQPGDSYHSISVKFKPKNVNMDDYVTLLKNINLNKSLHTSQVILIPTKEDMKYVLLPDVTVHFNYKDPVIIDHIKESEGSVEFQSKNKRRLLGGKVGVPFYNSKFHPYKDSRGNYTIGYGHYLGKKDSDARKFRNGITKAQAHNLLLQDMKRTYEDFTVLMQKKKAVNLSKEQQRVLFEMAFTMGIDKLSTFDKLWKSAKMENNKKFKREIINSLWYRQVTNRADLLVSSL